MPVLIVSATVEGQTQKIADYVADQVHAAGHDAIMFDADDKTAPVSFKDVEQIILAAPVHERRHPQTFEVFLSAHRSELVARNTLFLSVSLSAAFPEGVDEAWEYVTEMEMRTKFKANAKDVVAGAVRTQNYDYFASQVMRHVVLRGRDYDPSQGAHEFTDWHALKKTISGFLAADVSMVKKADKTT